MQRANVARTPKVWRHSVGQWIVGALAIVFAMAVTVEVATAADFTATVDSTATADSTTAPVVPAPESAASTDASTVAATVEALEWKRMEAMVNADIGTLERLMAHDMTYTHSIGLVQTRQQLFDMITSGQASYVKFTTQNVRWQVYPNTVVGVGSQIIELRVDGNPVGSRNRFTVVWARIDDAWKCVAYQSTTVPDLRETQKSR